MIVTGDVDDFVHDGVPCLAAYKFDHGIGHISDGVLGGFWYSMPEAGECKGTHFPGDGSGCSWRVAKDVKHVNASCVNGGVERLVEEHGKDCFNTCAEPHNAKTACYAICFAATINGNTTAGIAPMDREVVVAPFAKAFTSSDVSKGGCPDIRPGLNSQIPTSTL